RAAGERTRPQQGQLPARKLVERTDCGTGRRPVGRVPLEYDPPLLPYRAEQLRVDAPRDDAVVTGEPQPRSLGDLRRGRDQRVHACEQTVTLCLAERVGEPVGREEGGDG